MAGTSTKPPPTPDLVVDLSLARVSITSAFQGESILLFGMFDPPGEIVVVVAGPAGREGVGTGLRTCRGAAGPGWRPCSSSRS